MPARIAIDAPTRGFSGSTNAYVLGSDDALLVDPAGRDEAIDEAIRERNAAHLAVTHTHPDHVGAVAEYAREYDLTVWGRPGRESAFEDATGITPDHSFSEGTTLPAGEGIEVLDTPGHAPEHVAFEYSDGDERMLVTGDLAVAAGSVVVGAPEGDMRAYLSSLRRVHARNPDRLLPGHGPVIEEPRETCKRLLDHRLDRERRVRSAVQAGEETPGDIVDAIYEKDISEVYNLALATTVAHLEKLTVEGRVRWNGKRAAPK